MAEKFELRRSPRAQLSQAIAAVNDDRATFVELVLGVVNQFREWQMNRASNVREVVFVRRQNIDDLTAVRDDALHFSMVDDPHSST